METRLAEAQKFSESGYAKMIMRINGASRDRHIAAIQKFFELGEDKLFDRTSLEGKSDDEVKTFCIEICTEAINRDFCTYISTGEKSNVGSEVYKGIEMISKKTLDYTYII